MNKTMKSGQLIKYNRKIFLEKSCTKCGEKLVPGFSLKIKISLGQQSEVLYSLLLFYVQVKDYQNMLKLKC